VLLGKRWNVHSLFPWIMLMTLHIFEFERPLFVRNGPKHQVYRSRWKQCHSECALPKGQWHAEGWKEQGLHQTVVESGWKEEEPSRGTADEGCCNLPKTSSRSPATPGVLPDFNGTK